MVLMFQSADKKNFLCQQKLNSNLCFWKKESLFRLVFKYYLLNIYLSLDLLIFTHHKMVFANQVASLFQHEWKKSIRIQYEEGSMMPLVH